MSCWLKQSTTVDVMLGPFLDSVDGNTVESGLTITQPDIRLSKNGGAFAQKSAAQTLAHGENGWYPANLSTTDTNTLGALIVAVHESGALPVWREFLVVPANVYDSLILGTDFLQSDLAQWIGLTPLGLSSGRIQSLAVSISADTIDDTVLHPRSGLKPIRSGFNAVAGANNSITLDATASAVNDFYKHTRIDLVSGTGVGQSRICTGYDGSTKIATVEPNWITNPAAGTGFVILPDRYTPAIVTGGIASTSFAAGAINAAAIAAGAIDDDAVAADMDAYHGKAWVVKEGTTADHWGVAFFKNGQPVTAGITSPTIQVYGEDGTDLIAVTALTEIGSTGTYKKVESTNKITAGAIYFAKIQATIDGATRSWLQQLGRDSV